MIGLQKLVGKIEWSKMHTLFFKVDNLDGKTLATWVCCECVNEHESLFDKFNFIPNDHNIYCEDVNSVKNWLKYFKAYDYYHKIYITTGNPEAAKILKRLIKNIQTKIKYFN